MSSSGDRLGWFCPANGPTDGYGNAGENIILALDRAGHDVGGIGAGVTYCEGSAHRARALIARNYRNARNSIFLAPPPFWPAYRQRAGRTLFGFSMYEIDRLPPLWASSLDAADEIWVPCHWNAEVFRRYTRRTIVVIRLGVETTLYAPQKRVRQNKLRFFHSATVSSELRKGRDLAERAFTLAFPSKRHDVELVLRSAHPYAYQPSDPRIVTKFYAMTGPQQAAFYRSCDALIYPSRGEGFGFVPLEMMSTGGAAIFPAATGMADYAYLGMSVSATPAKADIGRGRPGFDPDNRTDGNWFEPNLDELVYRMREVDEAYDAVMERAYRSANEIAAKWSWANTVQAMMYRIRA